MKKVEKTALSHKHKEEIKIIFYKSMDLYKSMI